DVADNLSAKTKKATKEEISAVDKLEKKWNEIKKSKGDESEYSLFSSTSKDLEKILQNAEKIFEGGRFFSGDEQKLNNIIGETNSYLNEGINADNIKEAYEAVSKLQEELKGVAKAGNEISLNKLGSKVSKTLRENSAMSSDLKSKFEALKNEIYEIGKSGNYSEAEIKQLGARFEQLRFEMEYSGKTGRSFFDNLGNRIKQMSTNFLGMYFSLYDITRYTREAFTTIRELDDALVDLSKTSSMTTDELDSFYKKSNDIAIKMGVTTKEIINQASAFSRLGFSSYEESSRMAELSSKFASISPDMDVDTATDGLVSVIKAFDIDVEDVERKALDNINKIGNTAATSNGEIIDMLTRSSAAMKEANNSLEETIALETAAVEVTRNAETTGTAFKTKYCLCA
ncbi:MAG: phage tail tape measure protein, partial [Alphaproteobacteria bacterium]|nr:phage tail tape measure protein [Alphaproteobacteria bacterium]